MKNKKKPIILAITGGIGSGKTTVAQLLKLDGVPVYLADDRSKLLVDSSNTIKDSLKQIFGESIYKNGKLDKKLFAQQIFGDPELLQTANRIIHPEVKKDFINWAERQNSKFVVLETAILFESKFDSLADVIINIHCPLDQRVKRSMKRDNVSKETIRKRIENQMSDDDRKKLSTYTVINDNHHSVINQLNQILQNIH